MIIAGWSSQEALRRLDNQCRESLRTGYRPNTIRNYKSRANIYIRFCQIYQLDPFPTSEWNLIRYARYLANGVTSFGTVKGYLSAVKRFHEIAKIPFPTDLSLLKLELMSIRKELATVVKKATPMTPQLLLDIYNKVNLKSAFELVSYVALLIGFYLFLRRSNLVSETEKKFNPKEQLTRRDVWKLGKLTVVEIKWSKTNQYRDRDLIIPIIPAKCKMICPVFWINFLLQKLPCQDLDMPLFSYPKQGVMVPLTADLLAKKYKEWVKATGRNPDTYTLHGIRRGGVNHSLTVGLCGEEVMLMGGWVSNAYLQYIDLTLERRVTNMVKFVDEMDRMVDQADEWDKFDELDFN